MSRTMIFRPAVVLFLAGLLASCGGAGRNDLIVITLDTLRADRLGCYGNSDGLTPHLDRLAARGVLFEDASAAVPITLPSHCSLFTGRYPPATGVRNNGTFVLPDSEQTLAETLRDAGWSTGAVVAAYPVHSRFGIAQGFQIYDEEFPQPASKPGGGVQVFFSERKAEAVTDRAIRVWKRLGPGPRFLWVHYFDPHAPYDPPEPYASRFREHRYDGEVAYTDAQVGRLLDVLRRTAPRALIVVVADHGESLGEHGEKTHGVFVYQSTLHVPFLLVGAGSFPAGRRVSEPVSLVDVMPTVLDALGVSPPPDLDGGDLGPLVRGKGAPSRPVYAESYLPRLQFRFSALTTIRRGSLKYIEAPEPELYDLARDPGEQKNLHGSHPDEAELARKLSDLVASYGEQPSDQAAGGLDAEAEARLRSLGYASAGTLQRRPGEGRGRDPKTMVGFLRKYDRAVGWISQGRYDEAVKMLRELAREAPENYMTHYQAGAALLAAHRPAEAERELRRVVKAAPEFANGYLLLGEAQARLGRLDDAVRNFRAAARAEPRLAEPHFLLGQVLESYGRFTDASAEYATAVGLEPDHSAGRALLDLWARRGEPDRAIPPIAEITQTHPDRASSWALLAEAQRRAGKREDARASLERSLQLEPDRVDARVALGALELDAGDSPRAAATFRRALALRPGDPGARTGLARALLAGGDLSEGEAELARVIREHPRYAPALVALGSHLEAGGRPGKAAEAYRRALAADRNSRAAWEGLQRVTGSAPR